MVSSGGALLACSVAIVLLAGCAGGIGGAADDGSTPTPSATATATPTETAVPTPPAGATIAYSALTDRQQRAFDDALRPPAGVEFSSSLPGAAYDLDDADPFEAHRFVVRDGVYYEVETRGPSIVAGADEVFVAPTEAPQNGAVVHLGNRSESGYSLLREAVENGSAMSVGVRSPVSPGTVLEYRGEYYVVEKVYTVDFGALQMEVRRYDGG